MPEVLLEISLLVCQTRPSSFSLNNENIKKNRINSSLSSIKDKDKEHGPEIKYRSVLGSNISLWTERWSLSSNAKDIGTLYLIFALFSALLGTAFSILIRLELIGPGVQFIADNQLYNAI